MTGTLHLSAVADMWTTVCQIVGGRSEEQWLAVDHNWCHLKAQSVGTLAQAVMKNVPQAEEVLALLHGGGRAGAAIAVNFVLLTVLHAKIIKHNMEEEQKRARSGAALVLDDDGNLAVPPPSEEQLRWLKNPIASGNLCAYEPVAAFGDVNNTHEEDNTDCMKIFDMSAKKGGRCGKAGRGPCHLMRISQLGMFHLLS